MGALARAVGERSGLATPEKWLVDFFKGGTDTPSGINVTEDTALHYGPFFAGVRIISEDLGSLPFPLYQSLDPRGKRKAKEHPLYPVIHNEANPVMSSQAFRETLTGHAVMWGGGFAEIVRKRGVVRELWPLRPDRMKVKFNRRTRRLIYDYDDQSNGTHRKFLPDEILHIHGLGFDGVRGYSVLELARNSIGAGVASEQFGAAFFGNAARPSGFLRHPGVLGTPARKNLRESIENMHKGSQNTGRIALLEEGMEWQSIGIPPDDAQFLETRRFDVLDMARWLRLPPFMLAELGRATWNNIESEKIDYVTKSLRTWLTRWEQAVWMRLLDSEEQQTFFAEHTIEGLLRGDTKSRFDAYRIGREIGVYSADDINELENRNPLPDDKGTVYFVPLNWVPAPGPDDETVGAPGRERHPSSARNDRSAESRRRIAEAFEPLLIDIEARLAKIERNQVLRLVKKHLADPARTAVTFEAAIRDLYTGEILDQTTERWLATMETFAKQISAEAADEVQWTGTIEIGNWVVAYVVSHAAHRVQASAGRLSDIATAADTPEEAAEGVVAQVDKWVKDRPGQVARKEAIQMSNAAAREIWRGAGVRQMKWVAIGKNCPFCTKLNGTIVGTEETFMDAGTDFEGADGEVLAVTHNTHTPPAHTGCNCMVVALGATEPEE